ncbi:Gfo/Idh/MocA family protein [Jonesia quinghaiensis]|uniref:Gfo/Idh/MocA family protein n=1 Tax=Jonesia quinghaiensis TaxID=262806 RepID=UPI00056422D2|nr:Gfo/Idh/MocA family oxidoreductase [Jonesia quinghaiensis]
MTFFRKSSPRAALTGYGMAGRQIHTPLLQEAGWNVTAVVTNNTDRANQARDDWGAPQILSTVEELISRRDDYDVVIIVSPSATHHDQATQLIEAGIPVIVDKPLAVGTQAAQSIVDAASRHNVPLTVFQNRRWDREQLTLRHLVDTHQLGDIHTFERRWERWRPEPKNRWKENDPASGGLLHDLGAHLVDSAVQLFGPVGSVHATVRSLTTPANDDVFLTLTHENGVVSRLQAGALVGAPGPRTRVLGSRGAYCVTQFEGEATPFSDPVVLTEQHEGWMSRGNETVPVPAASGNHADFYRESQQWLAGDRSAPVDPQDAVYTAHILDLAQTSADHNTVERVTQVR